MRLRSKLGAGTVVCVSLAARWARDQGEDLGRGCVG